MNFFQDFRTETKLLLAVALAAVVLGVGGIWLLRAINPPVPEGIPQTEQVQQTQETSVDWTGVYKYSEFAQGIGSNQTWVYEIDIKEENGALKVSLAIDGFQTLTRIQATAQEHNGSLDIVFDSYAPENATLRGLQKGDLLFSLRKVSDNEYEILWGQLQSNLLDSGQATFEKQPLTDTYRNSEYGFEFQHPNNIAISPYNVGSALLNLRGVMEEGAGNYESVRVTAQDLLSFQATTVGGVTVTYNSATGVFEQTTYSGQKVALDTLQFGQNRFYRMDDGDAGYYSQWYIIANQYKNIAIQFTFSGSGNAGDKRLPRDQILSTFRFVDATTCSSMEIKGYDYMFSEYNRDVNGEVKADLNRNGQEEIVRVYKEDATGEHGKPIIVKIFTDTQDCPKEVFRYFGEELDPYDFTNEFYSDPKAFLNFWGDGSNVVVVNEIGTAHGSGYAERFLFFTYRSGNYELIRGPRKSSGEPYKFAGENGIGNKLIVAQRKWEPFGPNGERTPGSYCAGCASKMQFVIYTWNGEEYDGIAGGLTQNLYLSEGIDEILAHEPDVLNTEN